MARELSANLAEATKQFSYDGNECDVVLLRKSPDGKAQHRYRNRECTGGNWLAWCPSKNLVDFDHLRMILIDRGWGWTTEYCPHSRLHTFTVIVRLRYYSAVHTNYKIAACEALLKTFTEESKLEKTKDEYTRRS